MADKKEPAAGWPVISGDYIVGDPESPVMRLPGCSFVCYVRLPAAVERQSCRAFFRRRKDRITGSDRGHRNGRDRRRKVGTG